MSEKCRHNNNSDNHLISRRADGGKNWRNETCIPHFSFDFQCECSFVLHQFSVIMDCNAPIS